MGLSLPNVLSSLNPTERLRIGAAFGLILLLWGMFGTVLYYHWGGESYYNFGWYVLPGFALLFWLRLRDLPTMRAPDRGRALPMLAVLAVALLLLYPLRLFNEVNVFWRVPFLAQGLLLMLASFLTLLLLGGRRVALHFGWALLFLITMVPWPYRIEIQIIQQLTAWVTEAAVLLLKLLGYPSSVRGNTILIGSSWVGVDEACSGIRSLQALLMIALWLGECFRLRLARRIVLLLCSLALMFIFNALRATGLSVATFHGGIEAYDRWHDAMGYISFFSSILVLYFAGEKLAGNLSLDQRLRPVTQPGSITALRGQALVTAVTIVVLTLGQPVFVHLWFREADAASLAAPRWTLVVGQDDNGRVDSLEIGDRVAESLGFDFGSRWRIPLGLGKELDLYFYGYTGDDRMSSVSSYGHSPLICVKGIGADVSAHYDPLLVRGPDGLELRLNHIQMRLQMDDGEVGLSDLFWCVWEPNARGIASEELQSLNYKLQWEMVKAGRRDFSRQVILVGLRNAASPSQARMVVRRYLESAIVLQSDAKMNMDVQ